MKLRITRKQLNELSKKGKENYLKNFVSWSNDLDEIERNNDLPIILLTIGQMIEFLSEQDLTDFGWSGYIGSHIDLNCEPKDVCNYLWSITERVLNK